MTYTVVLRAEPEGGYAILVPMVPEIVSYGTDLEDARAMAAEALDCCLGGRLKSGEFIPEETHDDPPVLDADEATGALTILRLTANVPAEARAVA